MSLPPLPTWDALHPLVVHFPVALLLTAPLLVLMGLALPRAGRGFLNAALAVMVLGTVAAWVAVGTGEAAGELATRTPAVRAALEQHEELAETTRTVFTLLTLTFAVLLLGPALLKRTPGRRITVLAGGAYLVCYLFGSVLLANTAHQGGRLVHGLGVHALMPAEPGVAAPAVQGSGLLQALEKGDDD